MLGVSDIKVNAISSGEVMPENKKKVFLQNSLCFRCWPVTRLEYTAGLNCVVKIPGFGEPFCYKLVWWCGFAFVLLDERVNYRLWRRRATVDCFLKIHFISSVEFRETKVCLKTLKKADFAKFLFQVRTYPQACRGMSGESDVAGGRQGGRRCTSAAL
ncbi:hypothetical protein HUB98_14815 [Paenibacillus barcinonensis]|uniref:Uncharacterized protein n=1 Tax=Paenibacillus barcinonensis TaxID=198119 RepID=A0A2V4VC14_PAEBA|nr:hypothetical protein [Paenibacillus barcinonensis]PYE50773.1 hypothetical protein DFQ00_103191 [Paenibacillus barcinonensis]QKS57452.1 hypothetical protein HUB98_14815 [Paenibacillus barcinonensis]